MVRQEKCLWNISFINRKQKPVNSCDFGALHLAEPCLMAGGSSRIEFR